MEKFTKLYKKFADEGLSPNEQVALAYMYDRMDLSEGNSNFYDNQHNGYYITYSRSELANQLNVSEATVTSIFNKLVTKGWLIIKRRFNSTNRIFLLKSLKSNNSTSKVKKLDYNYTELKHTKTTDTKETKVDNRKLVASYQLDALADSIVQSSGLNQHAVNILKAFSFGDVNKLYNYAGLVFKAKKCVLNAHKDVSGINAYGRFETNEYINNKLDKLLKDVIPNAERKAKNKSGYIFRSLFNFFEEEIDSFMQNESKIKKASHPMYEQLA
ncbi:hypothetical protein AKUA2103_PHAGE100620 (plasmid) [Apilactobacillus kunkeei]|nr:hypothetical protein AKUA2103_PHAGE100620 [Apilactobacillus kunkeei]CAI2699891.1 hypothetical protein AKUA1003_PHAGE100620 [Apilactobacillus kunkeei]